MTIGSIAEQPSPDTAAAPSPALLESAEQARLRGDYRTGTALARQAAEAAAAAGDHLGQARALRSLANQLIRLGEHEAAVTACSTAAALLDAGRDEVDLCETLTVQAMPCTELGLHEEALVALDRARHIAHRRADRALLYWVHNRTGVVHSMMGNYAQATDFFMRALTMAAGMDEEARFCVLNNLADNAVLRMPQIRMEGRADLAQQVLDDALGHAEAALALARSAAHPFRLAIALDNYAMLLAFAGDYDRAVTMIDDAQAIAADHGYRTLQPSILQHRAQTHLLRGECAAGAEGLLAALEAAAETGEKSAAMAIHRELCTAYEGIGDHAAALRHYREFHRLEREAHDDVTSVRARMTIHHFELDNARVDADNARIESEVHRVRSLELEADKLSLQRQAVELDRYAHEDALTGLANRRFVDLRLPQLLAGDGTRQTCVAIADIDHFKGVNDRFGHLVGDEVLRRVAAVLRDSAHDGDLVARLGGEEFLIAFDGADLADAYRRCELLRARVSDLAWASVHPGLAVTMSIGVAPAGVGADHREMLARADRLLYAAKRAGRNRVQAG